MQPALIAQQVIGGIAIGCVYALIALGFTMMLRASGLLNFAHGEVMMLGAMLGYTCLTVAPLPYPVVFALVLIAGAVLGLALERLVFRPLRARRAPLVNAILATVGLLIIMENGARLIWGAQPLAYPPVFAREPLPIPFVRVIPQNVWITGLSLLLMGALQLFFHRTRLGVALRASASDPEMARLVGISTNTSVSWTLAISSALGAAAGVLLGPLFYASYDLGTVGMKGFAAAALGGLGSVGGAMLGGVLLGVIETIGGFVLPSSYKDVIAFSVLVLVLLLWPSGLLGRADRSV